MKFQTEFEFYLPCGYLDTDGQRHRQGRMRLATALDEIESVQDPRVQANEAYLSLVLLSRVLVQLGDLCDITPQLMSKLFAADLAYLEDMYQRHNAIHPVEIGVSCPHCANRFQMQVAPLAVQASA